MANTKPVGVAYSDPALVAGTTITGATITGGTITSATIASPTITGATLTTGAFNGTVGATTPSTGVFTTATANAIAAGDASLGVDGLAAAQGGAIVVTGGTSSTSGNAGGAVSIVGGTPGATGVGGAASVTGAAGGATSGTGGAANITAGAGTAGNANGGNVVITSGAAHGSGVAGVILHRGLSTVAQGAPSAKTTSATLTAAELLSKIITVAQGGGANSAQQLPLATDLDTATPSFAAGDAFDFHVINISTVAAETASITTNTGWTLVGNMLLAANTAVTDNSQGTFRARKTGAGAWSLYRLA